MTLLLIPWYLATRPQPGATAVELGWYGLASGGSLVVAGPLAARGFHRWPVKSVMVVDLGVRVAMLSALGLLLSTHGAAHRPWFWCDVTGALLAISLVVQSAGGPNLWARLIAERSMPFAMQLVFNGASVAAPVAMTGLLLVEPTPTVLVVLGGAMALAAINLAAIAVHDRDGRKPPSGQPGHPGSLRRVWRRVHDSQALWVTTGLCGILNFAFGGLAVFWPLVVHEIWRLPAAGYARLMLAEGVGGVVGSLALSYWVHPRDLLRAVLWTELGASLATVGVVVGLHAAWCAALTLAVVAGLSAGAATWTMTLRFRLIPEDERPAVLAYVRTTLMLAGPFGAALAGHLWNPADVGWMLWAAVGLMTVAAGLALLSVSVGLAGSFDAALR